MLKVRHSAVDRDHQFWRRKHPNFFEEIYYVFTVTVIAQPYIFGLVGMSATLNSNKYNTKVPDSYKILETHLKYNSTKGIRLGSHRVFGNIPSAR